jgi:lipoyl(octanoyl) transferase
MEGPDPLSILVYVVAPSGPSHDFLLLRRLPTRGGFWQGVTGGVEPGEALDEAAVRELMEETSLAPSHLVPTGFHYSFPVKKRPAGASSRTRRITEHVFLALLAAKVDPRIDPAEHDAWDWYSFEEALTWLRWPENIEALRRCEALISDSTPPRTP